MGNKKVYLAKSNGASGADVEYIRTSLLRIPGIEIVEYSSGINASECVGIVIVPESTFDLDSSEGDVKVTKNVGSAVNDFLCVGNELDSVFVFTEKVESHGRDVEELTPLTSQTLDFDLEYGLEDLFSGFTFDHESEGNLLEAISELIGSKDITSFRKFPRHHQPAPEYSLPPLKDFESRKYGRVKSRITEESVILGTRTSAYVHESPIRNNSASDSNKPVTVKLLGRKRLR